MNDLAVSRSPDPEPFEGWSCDVPDDRLLARVRAYCLDGLAKRHPDLGRAGPVCPFIYRAVRGDYLSVQVCRLGLEDEARLRQVLNAARAALSQEMDAGMPGSWLRSMIVILPKLCDPDGIALIERIQRELKTQFVENGLMLGEFYPGCQAGGLHNPEFRPLNAPVPFLAIRVMTEADEPFLRADARHRAAYLKRFSEKEARDQAAPETGLRPFP